MYKDIMSLEMIDYDDYFNQVRLNYKNIDNPFWYFENLINELLNINDIDILPLCKFVKENPKNKSVVGLRFDVDADPITAVRCSRYLARVGLSASFYLLHTAQYYGLFEKNIFIRNPMVRQWIQEIIIAGSEIGIHNDILGCYFHHKVNGLQAFKAELEWMRGCGAKITGTTAHNTFLSYDAENYEIFKEHLLFKRNWRTRHKSHLAQISKKDVGLEYEGTFGIAKQHYNMKEIKKYKKLYSSAGLCSNEWTSKFLLDNPVNDWSVDYQVWLVGKNKWIFSGNIGRDNFFEFEISLVRVIEIIKNKIKKNSKILFVLHPEYFGSEENEL